MADDKAELWAVYQALGTALRSGSTAQLQETAKRLADRIGKIFQNVDRSSDKPSQ